MTDKYQIDGDEICVPMKSGKTAILRVKNLKHCMDPKDQYFADLEDVGYADEMESDK